MSATIYRNFWTMMTSDDYDIMYRKGTSHRDLYKAQDTKDAGIMRTAADGGGFFPMRNLAFIGIERTAYRDEQAIRRERVQS